MHQWDVGPSVYKECSFPLIFINTRQTCLGLAGKKKKYSTFAIIERQEKQSQGRQNAIQLSTIKPPNGTSSASAYPLNYCGLQGQKTPRSQGWAT